MSGYSIASGRNPTLTARRSPPSTSDRASAPYSLSLNRMSASQPASLRLIATQRPTMASMLVYW